jgi:hypothetical protein
MSLALLLCWVLAVDGGTARPPDAGTPVAPAADAELLENFELLEALGTAEAFELLQAL